MSQSTPQRKRVSAGVNEWLVGGSPATVDDVSVLVDGRRLDSEAKVRAFFDEIERKGE